MSSARVDLLVSLREQFRRNQYARFEARAFVSLPRYWRSDLMRAVNRYGTDIQHTGRGPGSLEPDATAGLDYRVLTTTLIRKRLGWLWVFYTSPLLCDAVAEIVGCPVETRDGEDALNVNCMFGQKRYEWHHDPDPYTLLLYGSHTSSFIGGGLKLAINPHSDRAHCEITVYPRAGECVLIDGAATPHAVESLAATYPGARISAPMVFFPVGHHAAHDTATSSYLYHT